MAFNSRIGRRPVRWMTACLFAPVAAAISDGRPAAGCRIVSGPGPLPRISSGRAAVRRALPQAGPSRTAQPLMNHRPGCAGEAVKRIYPYHKRRAKMLFNGIFALRLSMQLQRFQAHLPRKVWHPCLYRVSVHHGWYPALSGLSGFPIIRRISAMSFRHFPTIGQQRARMPPVRHRGQAHLYRRRKRIPHPPWSRFLR